MDNHDSKPRNGRAINRRQFLALATRTTGAAMALGAVYSLWSRR